MILSTAADTNQTKWGREGNEMVQVEGGEEKEWEALGKRLAPHRPDAANVSVVVQKNEIM